jgi:hypothetical protein
MTDGSQGWLWDDPEPFRPVSNYRSPDPPEGMSTLEEAREFVSKHAGDGVTCPCCDQNARRYCRKLNSGTAHALIDFYHWSNGNADKDGWVGVGKDHMTKRMCLTYHHNEFHKARWWGLIEQRDEARVEGHRSEYWRLTKPGRLFAEAKATVPSHAMVYDNRCLETIGEPVDIHQALGREFDYYELMDASRAASRGIIL